MNFKKLKNKIKKFSTNYLIASYAILLSVIKSLWNNQIVRAFIAIIGLIAAVLGIYRYINPVPLHPEVKNGMKEVSEIRQLLEQDIDKLNGFDEGDKEKLNKVVQLQKEGKLHESMNILTEIENKYLKNMSAVYFLKGNNFIIVENYLKAIYEYDRATTINPDFADAWYNKSIALFKLGRYEDVIACCDRVISINPKASASLVQKASALGKLGRYEDAIKCCDIAIDIKPDFANAWYTKGVALFILGRNGEALACSDEAIAIKSDFAEAWYNKCAIFRALGRYEESIASCDEAIAIKPDYAKAWGNKGFTLFILGRYKEVFETFIQFLYRNTLPKIFTN